MYQDAQPKPPAESYQIRNSERTPISFAALMLRDGQDDLEVKVRNFSRKGFSMLCDGTLGPDTPFRLRLPSVGDMKSVVKWGRGRRHGCEFERELTPHQLLEILRSPYFPKPRMRDRVRVAVSKIFSQPED